MQLTRILGLICDMWQIKSQGLVLKRSNYSETDKIITLLTKHKGKMTFIAKGVRRMKSKKRGHLEIFNLIDFSAQLRGGSLGYLTEVKTIRGFPKLRQDLKKMTLAYYFMEVVGRVSPPEEANEHLFGLVGTYLSRLEKTDKLKNLRANFINELLVLLGFWPKDKPMLDPDYELSEVLERKLNSVRVGKKLLN